jgi:hypothetical protein
MGPYSYLVIKTEILTRVQVFKVYADNEGDAIRDARDSNLEIEGEPTREVKWIVTQEKM